MKAALLSMLGACSLTCAAAAQSTAFTYQGRLDDSGAPAQGSYDLQFELQAPGGTPVVPALVLEDVTVTGGWFTVELDFGAGACDNQAVYTHSDGQTYPVSL